MSTLTLNGNKKRLRRQDIVNYANEWEHYEIDFNHSLASYLIVKGGTAKTANEKFQLYSPASTILERI